MFDADNVTEADLLVLVEGVDECVPDFVLVRCDDVVIVRPVRVVLAVVPFIHVHDVELIRHLALLTVIIIHAHTGLNWLYTSTQTFYNNLCLIVQV